MTLSLARGESYVFTTVDIPGAASTVFTGINNAGQITGYFINANGTFAFLRTGQILTMIDVPGAKAGTATANGVNNLGEVVGSFEDARGTHGYLRNATGDRFTVFDVPDLGAGLITPFAVNDQREITGAGFAGGFLNYGFLLRIVEQTVTSVRFPQATNTAPRGINNRGEIAGSFRMASNGQFEGFVRAADGSYRASDVPGISPTLITALNNTGQLLGTAGGSMFVKNADGSYFSLPAPGIQTVPAGINDSGVVVGYFGAADERHAFIATPPPASLRPVIREYGVITASAFGGVGGIAPGTWIEIYGQNFAKVARSWRSQDFEGGRAPTSLEGASVQINGQPAFLSYVSPGQINALVPDSVGPGTARVTVSTEVAMSAAFEIPVTALQPGLMALASVLPSMHYAAAVLPDGRLALPQGVSTDLPWRPARAGETVTLYGVGFGPVVGGVPTGQAASKASPLLASVEILVNGAPAQVTYAGLSPGSLGLYQFNVVIPVFPERPGYLANVEFRVNGVQGRQQLLIGVAQ